jgi:CTP synthase
LGLCYGMQLAVVEFARNVCGLEGAHSTEVDVETQHPVINLQPSQQKIMDEGRYGGTMRLGAYSAELQDGSAVLQLYEQVARVSDDADSLSRIADFRKGVLNGGSVVLERHRHRYEVNPAYVEQLQARGLVFSGFHTRSDGTQLAEFIEIPGQSFRATQAHPEFKSRLEKPAPLFLGFIQDALSFKNKGNIPQHKTL